jgi:hypothetical protein
MQVYDGNGLGCWLAHNDPRSLRNFRYGAKLTTTRSVTHVANGPILDQGDVGACVGFTADDLMNTAKFYRSRLRGSKRRSYLPNDAGFDFYHEATVLDEWFGETWKPDDTGSSVLAGAKALKKLGYIDAYFWADDMTGLLGALQRQPVMLGTTWTSGMSDPDSAGLIRPTGEIVGGHAYMLYAVSYPLRRVKMRNHWTREWGVSGDAYIGFDDLEWLIAQQGEVLVPTPV